MHRHCRYVNAVDALSEHTLCKPRVGACWIVPVQIPHERGVGNEVSSLHGGEEQLLEVRADAHRGSVLREVDVGDRAVARGSLDQLKQVILLRGVQVHASVAAPHRQHFSLAGTVFDVRNGLLGTPLLANDFQCARIQDHDCAIFRRHGMTLASAKTHRDSETVWGPGDGPGGGLHAHLPQAITLVNAPHHYYSVVPGGRVLVRIHGVDSQSVHFPSTVSLSDQAVRVALHAHFKDLAAAHAHEEARPEAVAGHRMTGN
mmetsp:Transcript_58440/g.102743  ORF Transcript_58440/g.102743 Transcript_58440/m.102743 type:complete len:259 (+) Transcript_58440:264-1040(+)